MNCVFLVFINHPVNFNEGHISMYNRGKCVNIDDVPFDWSYVTRCCELSPGPLLNYVLYYL